MKKISLYALGVLLGASLVACDDYKEPNPPAQSNPEEPVLKLEDVTVAGQVQSSATYDLATLSQNNDNILLATVSCPTLPEGYTFDAIAYLSGNNFTNQYEVPVTVALANNETKENLYVDTYEVYVTPDDVQGVYSQYISKSPSAKEIGLRFVLKVTDGSQSAYLGGPTNYYSYNFMIKPFPSEMVIEDAYYLIGTIDDWSIVGAIKFNHSDLNPYDDPVFYIKFDITEEEAANGWWWKIIPESTYSSGDWSSADYSQFGPTVDGSPEASGNLMPRLNGVDPGAGDFQESGSWMLTINMMELTYEFSSAVEQLYTPGDSNGWNQGASQILTTNDYTNYYGYAYLSGGFKFTTKLDWSGIAYGTTGVYGELSKDGGAGNLTVDEAGLYWCAVNVPELTYNLTYIETIGLVGDATEGGWDASTALTPSDDYLTWSGEVTLTDGQFKFRANNGWDVNLGANANEEPSDNYGDLVENGKNLKSPGAGTYVVTLYLGQVPYSCTVVAK